MFKTWTWRIAILEYLKGYHIGERVKTRPIWAQEGMLGSYT